jgi:Flp pilus assembly protein TadD
LTGDAKLDWMSEAGAAIVAFDLTGSPQVFATRAATVRDAYALHATRVLHGNFTRPANQLRFSLWLEDFSRHKMARTWEIAAPGIAALDGAAHFVSETAHPFPETNFDAIAAWGHGDAARAVELEPDFGAAWLTLVESQAAKGDREGALASAARALARPTLRGPIERVRIEWLVTILKGDAAAQRTKLAELVKLIPADPQMLQALAISQMSQRAFSDAARSYRRLAELDPAEGEAFNSLGYAEAFAGNLEAARTALERYRGFLEANALDSLGEVHLLAGKFAEAEKYFLRAHEKNAAFHAGADLLKAAHAHWLGGDLPGADAIFQRYLHFRASLHDGALGWREAVWLYATGRRDKAREKVKSSPQIAAAQLAVWDGTWQGPEPYSFLLAKKFDQAAAGLKMLYERTPPPEDSQARVLYAWALTESGHKDEAAKLLAWWPLPGETPNPSLEFLVFESLVYPKFLELRRALGVK